MQTILQQAQKMQQQLQQVQEELAAAEVTGQAGNGLVEVTVTAGLEPRSVKIDPTVVDPEDVETLQDLVTGALADAVRRAQELQQQKMGPLAGGLDMGGLGLPGA
ncbi:YbaB/EbfC family nucleoid-associated protein [Pseudonocardia sp. C8]|uniref:YbaB/EbfC family nucleoid-associated protein n=1 Tax=Pseudonocardia sp. C8 TaxID=2762759 RepID=UPI001C93129A|nr:YbaB/EbfC family nucleoid-associated protein [Pseudonocardia sp. C8]